MKFAVLFLILLISPIELRRHDDADNNGFYELADLLGDRYERPKHRLNPSYRLDETNNEDNDDDEGDRKYPPVFSGNKVHPSRKKVLEDNESDNEELEGDDASTRSLPSSTTNVATESSDSSVCLDQYETTSEQLVKVKELTNGAHMIRYVLVDKRTLPMGLKVKDACILDCCAEKTCDLAMLSEQPTHDGYKCYLFACNGSCVLAEHKDYSVMMLKSSSITAKVVRTSTPIVTDTIAPRKGSIFRETTVILFLAFGLISTLILLVMLCCHCRRSRRRGLKVKNYSVDEDYLINGLYL